MTEAATKQQIHKEDDAHYDASPCGRDAPGKGHRAAAVRRRKNELEGATNRHAVLAANEGRAEKKTPAVVLKGEGVGAEG